MAAAVLLLFAGAGCSSPAPGMAMGESLWNTCTPCHGAAGQGNEALRAPAIAGLPQWYVEAQLHKFQSNWRGAHPMDTVGIRMKSMVRVLKNDDAVTSVSQYVASLPVAQTPATLAGNAVNGEALYRQACVACHGQQGLGLEALGAPPLVGQSDWYMVAQYEKYRRGWRGAVPEDASGTTMRVSAQVLTTEQIPDVIAYIRTFPLN